MSNILYRKKCQKRPESPLSNPPQNLVLPPTLLCSWFARRCMLSENAHVTPSLMLLGNTHCEVEVKKKNLSPSAFFLQTFL
jgi:hypothetical protein